jgi:hypothetical protein
MVRDSQQTRAPMTEEERVLLELTSAIKSARSHYTLSVEGRMIVVWEEGLIVEKIWLGAE